MKLRTVFNTLAWMLVAVTLGTVSKAHSGLWDKYKRSVERYDVPDVTLVDQNGQPVRLQNLLTPETPILLDFIYGTCTTICPVLSAGFSNFQKRLGPELAQVKLVSVSIDPEHDTPEVLSAYLERYHAKPGWDFLTGTRKDIDRVMRAFDAYVPDKMSHYPLTFIRGAGQERWVRIYGLIGTKELLNEYRKVQPDDTSP